MCEVWTEHDWQQPMFLESGKSPTMGRFNRFLVRCNRCGRETLQTEWLDLSSTISRTLPTDSEEVTT